jgi:hypothetical protein
MRDWKGKDKKEGKAIKRDERGLGKRRKFWELVLMHQRVSGL